MRRPGVTTGAETQGTTLAVLLPSIVTGHLVKHSDGPPECVACTFADAAVIVMDGDPICASCARRELGLLA